MIGFLYRLYFSPKKQKTIILMLLVMILSLVLFIDPWLSKTERMMYDLIYYEQHQSLIMQSLYVMMPLVTLMIAIDHDKPYLYPLYAWMGRMKIDLCQCLMYLLILGWVVVTVGIMHAALISIYYDLPINRLITDYGLLMMDLMILIILILRYATEKAKSIGYLLVTLCITWRMILEIKVLAWLYYVLPFGIRYPEVHRYDHIYKGLYLCFLLMLLLMHRQQRPLIVPK